MAAPYLIVGLAGDSNGMWGKYRLTDGTDDGGSRIFSMNNMNAHGNRNIVAANEPLQNLGYGDADGQTGQVGSTLALCRKLRDEGHLPSGYDILIVPRCWAGTAFLNFWATTGDRLGIDEFITSLNLALATHVLSRIWFCDWNHGANDGGQSQTQYQNNMIATWGEIRSTVPTAAGCPILVPGLPPNRYNPALGNQLNLGGVVAAQQNVESYLSRSKYIDVSDRTEIDTSNGYVHFTAASHRGGTNNAPGNTSEVVAFADSIAGRKFDAVIPLLAAPTFEISMKAPNAISVIVNDTPPVKGNIVPVYQDESATNYDTWVTRNNPRDANAPQSALVIGNSKKHLRFADQLSANFVDRMDALVVGNWSVIGSDRAVTAVRYGQAQPIDHAFTGAGGTVLQVTLRHEFILELDGALAEGSYSVSNPTASIVTPFVFNDRETRANGIHVSQIGYRVSDSHKLAILAARRPGGANSGTVNFASEYGFSEFHILDARKEIVWSSGPGGIVLRSDPDDTEPGYTNIQVADLATERTITSITRDNPGVVTTSTNHDLLNGDVIRFRGMPTGSWVNNLEGTLGAAFAFTVTKLTDTTFSFGVNTSAYSVAYAAGGYNEAIGGHDSKVYKCFTSNRNGTHVYGMDFSAFQPSSPGVHYVYIPGYGISDPFYIHEAAYALAASAVHKGIYAMRRGCPITVGTYSRGENFRDNGLTHWRVFWTKAVGALSSEFSQFTVPAANTLTAGAMAYDPAITTTRFTSSGGMGYQDAGDFDGPTLDHVPALHTLAFTLHELPAAARHTNWFKVERRNMMSEINPTRYAGTDSWPQLMQEVLWYADFLLNTQQGDGRVTSGFGLGHFSSQSPNYGENSAVYRGTHKNWGSDNDLAAQESNRVHGYVCSADHPSNYWAAALFAKVAQLAYGYGATTLGDTYKDAAVLAYDWAEDIRNSHLGDGTVRDAYYITTLELKTLSIGHQTNIPGAITSVDTGTDIATTSPAHLLTTGAKVRVANGPGTIVGGLSATTDYWVNCPTGTTLSFHTNSTDAASGANKVDLTASGTGRVIRVLTDAEYATAMTSLHNLCVNGRFAAAGALLRILGPTEGSLYNIFIAGTPNDGDLGTYEYARAYEEWPGELNTTTYNYYTSRFFLQLGDEFGYNTSVQGFPRGGRNNAQTQWSNTAPVFSVILGLFQALKASDATNRDNALLFLRAHTAFLAGRNAVGKCFIKGAGQRHAICHLHDDAFFLGQDVPDGNINYAWFLWPQIGSNISSWIGHLVGPLTWANDNVPNNATGDTYWYKCTEPWRAAGPFWFAQGEARGSIFLGEGQLHQTMVPSLLAALVSHAWDGNSVNTVTPAVHFRRRK